MKNTFVKLFLALALCFMVGCALVACGGSTIAISEDGYWVIDGEKTNVKAAADEVANCNHEIVEVEVKAHTATKDGVVLEVCALCNDYAKVTAGTIHEFAEGAVAATCTEDGFNGEVCTICGAYGDGETVAAAGHNLSDNIFLVKDKANPACTKGGVAVQHCSVCKFVTEPVAVDPVGHIVENWIVTDYPDEAMGVAGGYCIYCDGYKTYDLPALDEEKYDVTWKDGKAATCNTEGVKLYSYIVTNTQNDDLVWDYNLVCEYEAQPAKAAHMIGGKNYNAWIANGAYQFYADVDGDGDVEAVGFEEYAETSTVGKIDCEETKPGYFVCEACAFVVPVEKLYKAHFGAETIVTAATCYAPGTLKVDCVNCPREDITKTYTVEHDYAYKLIDDPDSDEATAFILVATCKNTIPAKEEGGKATACVDGNYTQNVVANKIDEVKTTCYKQGYDLYRYNKEIATDVVVPVEIPVYKTDVVEHTLNGKTLDKYDFVEGYEGIRLNTAMNGILPVRGEKFTTCGEVYDVVFECSVCAAYKNATGAEIGTIVPERAYMPHNEVVYVVEGENGSKAPTCTAEGKEFFKCLNEGCALAAGQERILPALGHDYALTYTVDVDAATLTVKGVCAAEHEEDVVDYKFETTVALEEVAEAFDYVTKTEMTCYSPLVVTFTGYIAVVDVEVVGEEVVATLAPATYDEDEKVYTDDYVVAVVFDYTTGEYAEHDFCDAEAYETVVYERDWNEDGIIDAIETYVFKYCEVCYTYKQVGEAKVEQLTEITEKPAEDAE